MGLLLVGMPARAAQQKPPSNAPQKTEKPAQPAAPPVVVCPPGQKLETQASPFGMSTGCVPIAPATPPAQAPAPAVAPDASKTPPAQPQSTPAVTTTQGAQPAKPATPAPAATQTKPEAGKPAEPENKPEPKIAEIPPGESPVALNLENADLYQVLRIIGQELRINYIVDPAVKGTVTINTSVSVTRKDLFSLLQMILGINGAAAVKSNGYYSIVPLASAKQQPTNFHYLKEAESGAPAEDAFSMPCGSFR